MKYKVNVYYMYCPRRESRPADYREYQKRLEQHMLRLGLREMFSVAGDISTVKGKYGKPYLKGMEQYHYNMSNTDGMVVCALSEIEVGVDAERKRDFSRKILKRCATDREEAYILTEKGREPERFFQIWTLKESYIKMTGEGMRFPLQEIGFEIMPGSGKQDSIIKCSREGAFYQKSQKEYWISLCVREMADVQWIEMENKGWQI